MTTQAVVDIVLLLFGLAGLWGAILGKNFIVADADRFEFKSKKPIPTWLGKLIAGVVGTAFVLYALTSLFSLSSG